MILAQPHLPRPVRHLCLDAMTQTAEDERRRHQITQCVRPPAGILVHGLGQLYEDARGAEVSCVPPPAEAVHAVVELGVIEEVEVVAEADTLGGLVLDGGAL